MLTAFVLILGIFMIIITIAAIFSVMSIADSQGKTESIERANALLNIFHIGDLVRVDICGHDKYGNDHYIIEIADIEVIQNPDKVYIISKDKIDNIENGKYYGKWDLLNTNNIFTKLDKEKQTAKQLTDIVKKIEKI